MLVKLIFKSLWVNWKNSLSFILALSVGLVGLSVLLSIRTAVEAHMEGQAQEILTSDLSISARRIFTEEERALLLPLLKDLPFYSSYSLFTMASSEPGFSRLTHLKALPKNYPFYGELLSENQSPLVFETVNGQPVMYGDQQLIEQLQVKIGDSIQIGEKNFHFKGLIEKDSSQGFRFSAMAPKVYVLKEDLKKTGLISFGSTVSETVHVRVPDPGERTTLKRLLLETINDNSVSVQTASEAAQGSIRALRYLGDYLGLISLVGFLLSALGAGFIFFESLGKQIKTFSIFQSLGLSRLKSALFLFLQILFLSLVACALTLIISLPTIEILSNILISQFDLNVPLVVSPFIFLGLLLLALATALFISAPHFISLLKAPLRNLLGNQAFSSETRTWGLMLFLTSPALIFFISFILSKSPKIAGFFTAGLFLTLIVTGLVGVFATYFLSRTALRSWANVAFQEMNGKKVTQIILFSVITISILLIDSVKQIEHSLQQQLNVDERSQTPSHFLFDIQSDQVSALKDVIEKSGLSLLQPSPLIRAKMISINGESYEIPSEENRFETREQEEEARFRNRGLNLSYRTDLQKGESLIAGKPLGTNHTPGEPLELSIEEDYAKRVNLKIEDLIQMEVQGLIVEGVVKNLRRVSWTTFLPNFFVIAQPGLLEIAPKTWLAALSRGSEEQTNTVTRELNKRFSNVSFVDLDQVIDKIIEITNQMSQALLLTALFVAIAGLFILFSISRYHFQESQRDLSLLKVLGADSKFLAKKVILEQLSLTILCLTLGLSGSFILSSAVLERSFGSDLYWSAETPLLLIFGLLTLSLTMSLAVFHWSRRSSPKDFLN